jgi:DNA repair exonuclease SbcCD ATPase subunit
MVAVALACVTLSACASSPLASHEQAAPETAPAAEHATATPASPLPSSDDSGAPSSAAVANLQHLIDDRQLTELRTTYNATYGASLLFQTSKLTYYVALFHGKQFWRVIQTDSYEDAESLYRNFAEQTRQLAQVDIDTTRLQAGNAYAEHLIALNREHLQNLQQDASYQQQQARQVAAAQQQAKQQAVTLSADLRSTSSQLDAMKQRIRELEKQQADPQLVLPAADATPAPASSAAVPGTTPSP